MHNINKMLENRKEQLTEIALSRISTLEHVLEYVVKPKILADTTFCDYIKEIPNPFDACMSLSEKVRKYISLSEVYSLDSANSINEEECQMYAIGHTVVILFQELNINCSK